MKAKLATHDLNPYLNDLQKLVLPRNFCKVGFISLFCGGGGLDLGFALAGFKPLFSSDIEKSFCKTIEMNLSDHKVSSCDIFNLSGKNISKAINFKNFIVIGGPPCQAFSILGDRGSIKDPRGKLVFEFMRFIKDIKPLAFIFENVPGLLTLNKGKDWQDILRHFKKFTGYKIQWNKLNSVNFGVPQYRERVVLVGFRDPVDFEWPETEFSESPDIQSLYLKPPRSSWMALDNIDNLPNHLIRIHGERVSKRYQNIKPGSRDKVDHTDRIHPDYPSGTVLVGSSNGGGRPFIHPFEHRHITVREGARLQSFPDWWVFEGTNTQQYRQVGNAVPPILAKKIAHQIKKALL